jgi:tRNA threonylcarbamoyladenosine biosynthesis protein TsaB
MLTLAIETSNPTAQHAIPGVALGLLSPNAPPQLLGHEPLAPATRHDDGLMPAIDRLTRRLGLAPRDLQAIAVSIGPGGYTALRIAVATANLLAFSTNARTIAIPTALAVAHALDPAVLASLTGTLGIALASKNDTAVIARFRVDHGPPNATPVALDLPGQILTADDLPPLGLTHLAADQFFPATFAARAASLNIPLIPLRLHPEAVLHAAASLLNPRSGDPTTASAIAFEPLAPLYLREPDAVTLWRQRQAKSI